jgi:hypothetical protein
MPTFQQVMMTFGGVAVPAPQVEYDGRSLTGTDGDDIHTWPDTSGNARDATGVQGPKIFNNVLNGHPIARYVGGSGEKLDFTGNAVTNVFTCVSVMKCTDAGTRTILAEGTGGDGPPRFYIDSNKIVLSEDDNVNLGPSSTSLSTSTYYTVGASYNEAASGAYVFYLNGATDGSGANATPDFTRRFSRVGCRSGNQNPFKGDIAYVAYWSSILTSGQLTALFANLRLVWGHY